jgi:hypothetical protein
MGYDFEFAQQLRLWFAAPIYHRQRVEVVLELE